MEEEEFGLIDLHCHLLPEVDDGAADLATSLEMVRLSLADGVTAIACTPHILSGVYPNSGPDIRRRVAALQREVDAAGLPMRLYSGSDAHVAPDFLARLRSGDILSLNNGRYVLVEPPHHILPPNLDRLFFELLAAGYVPILTHPERMSWADRDFNLLERLFQTGVWMQITAGAILGGFGSKARAQSERMLRAGMVHVVASDAHGAVTRPPLMGEALQALRHLVGQEEANNLVEIRPAAVLADRAPSTVPSTPRSESAGYETDEKDTFLGKVARYFGG